ncbi:uncharacterized protein LOC129766374 isoform X2 [Toxorhynchites rutilus septentrionalis]|uniref:uncharacterized protein LOC129766374 isoform X2 n=1 Tax=Toxorhynchites rutilus septentrionalis TaxID=329112 RepID=UPI0024793BA0|nr:uncharacterized protein LOC129766374 isoform X2 [Toxorhynchites rutilus septentrionalis]
MTLSNDIGGGGGGGGGGVGGNGRSNGSSHHHHHHHHRSGSSGNNHSSNNSNNNNIVVGRRMSVGNNSNIIHNNNNNNHNHNNSSSNINGYNHNNSPPMGGDKDWDFKKSTKYPESDDFDSLPPPPPPEDDSSYFDEHPPPNHHLHHHAHMNHLNTLDTGTRVDTTPEKVRKHRSNSDISQSKHHNHRSNGGGGGLHHKSSNGHQHHHHHHHHRHSKSSRADSVLSSDSDIRFTRRKLGDNQKCGCALIAGFLLILLFAGVIVYVGYTYLRPEPLPDRIFRGRLRVVEGDNWTSELADQNTPWFQQRARDYRERINLIMRRSDLREPYEGSEILALDGNEGEPLTLHFAMYFDPYAELVSTADLHSILMEEITSDHPRYFRNLTIDPSSLIIKEVLGQFDDIPGTSSSPLGGKDDIVSEIVTTVRPLRKCEPLRLNYCRSVGYNVTTYPNFFGHNSLEDVEADLISFRELVDAECFRQAFDFICRLLQPPCEFRRIEEPTPGKVCRQYCQAFWAGCGDRLPERFRKHMDCERFPESTGIQSCHSRPGCSGELQSNALSSRLCDGVADCPDLSDENSCTFCAYGAIYCGRGRVCYPKNARCDGKLDCPDGSDEKDCLSISPQVSYLTFPSPIVPYRPRFYSEGYAVFSEKGTTGKLCSVGMESNEYVRTTVAESLCKALGFERVDYSEIRNDTEPNTSYVRVLDPRASEISFVRTTCQSKQSLYVGCGQLECGVQSALPSNPNVGLPKMASPGDWPWLAALFRADTHVCDGTLVSSDWILTTESCFQGQTKATWMAIFGAVRLSSSAPWTQRRRIIGMVKSPVEGSTAALIRLENPVVFSDFVRPICLPDIPLKETIDRADNNNVTPTPHAERFSKSRPRKPLKEYRQYFETPGNDDGSGGGTSSDELVELTETSRYSINEFAADFTDEGAQIPKAEAIGVVKNPYPLPENSPQTNNYITPQNYIASFQPPKPKPTVWTNCNTLGWSRQRDHLQRVQLKISDMKPCENVSIATVNSLCTEAAYHKQDCSEEEFAGSPVVCLLPTERKWALVGVASWRIACAPNGVERPRMYDKITSNTQWIRETIAATV